MGWVFLALLIGVPLIELSVLIEVGAEIGAFPTILLCIATAAVGLNLVKAQGMQVMATIQQKSERQEPVGEDMIHGLFLLLAGFMLLFPGFISDALGALFLIPPFRSLLGGLGVAHLAVKSKQHFTYHSQRHSAGTVVDVDYEDITDSQPKEDQALGEDKGEDNIKQLDKE